MRSGKIYFGLLKTQVKSWINFKQEISMRPVCLLMIFLLFTLLYLLISLKINLLILLKEPSIEKALLNLHVTTETHVLLKKNLKKYHALSCQNVCDALTFLLDNIFIRFGTKLYRQEVGIPMGTNCAALVTDLFLFWLFVWAHWGLPDGFLLLRYSVLFTVESLSLLYLLFIS